MKENIFVFNGILTDEEKLKYAERVKSENIGKELKYLEIYFDEDIINMKYEFTN